MMLFAFICLFVLQGQGFAPIVAAAAAPVLVSAQLDASLAVINLSFNQATNAVHSAPRKFHFLDKV